MLFSTKNSASRTDRFLKKVAWVSGVLIGQGIVAAGACDLAINLFDLIGTHTLLDTQMAVGLMAMIAAIFVVVDLAVATCWVARKVRQNGLVDQFAKESEAAAPEHGPDSSIFHTPGLV
jgi:hypothetical protein